MSKTIQIKPIKKGFKAVKIKAVANEHYVIVDESGKSFNKLKFVIDELIIVFSFPSYCESDYFFSHKFKNLS